jgi:uncharacterized protein YdaU (DUF1376 family)
VNYYKHFIGDYGKKTGDLSLMEHGAYLLMMQAYYATEEPLPTGKALYRLVRADSKAERAAVDAVAKRFWKQTDAGLINPRADEEIAKARAQADTNRRIAEEREEKRRQARTGHEPSTKRATSRDTKDALIHSHSHSHSHSQTTESLRSSSVGDLSPSSSSPDPDGLKTRAQKAAVVDLVANFGRAPA